MSTSAQMLWMELGRQKSENNQLRDQNNQLMEQLAKTNILLEQAQNLIEELNAQLKDAEARDSSDVNAELVRDGCEVPC